MKKAVLLSIGVLSLTLFSFTSTQKSGGTGDVVLTSGGNYLIKRDVLTPDDKAAILALHHSLDQPLGWYLVTCSGTVDTKGCIAGSGCNDVTCNYEILSPEVKAQVDAILQRYL